MMYPRILITLILAGIASASSAQTALERYIDEALSSNIALQKKKLSYDKSLAALDEAKANFFPVLSIQARYSVARGGRAFVIPVGDLVNPLYQNLNALNDLAGSVSEDFPDIPTYEPIDNVEENFLRQQEHETTLRVVWPVFNAAIIYNQRIKDNLTQVEKISVDIYKRELVKEVKTGYFNYLKATEAYELYQNTLELVQENLRTTRSLFDNHKVTVDEVYAAEAQVKAVEQDLAVAEKNRTVAQAYFNFLLNRNYDTVIETSETEFTLESAFSLDAARQTAVKNRDELQQLSYYLAVAENKIKLDKGGYLPKVNLVADYGFQGTEYSFGNEDDFALGSLVLSWDLFNKQTSAKIQQSKIDQAITLKRQEEARQQIGLEVVQAFHEVQTALKSIELAKAQVESAQKAFKLVDKKYSQGQANRVQFTDARTRLTNAEQQLIIARYDYQIRIAELEKAMATYPF